MRAAGHAGAVGNPPINDAGSPQTDAEKTLELEKAADTTLTEISQKLLINTRVLHVSRRRERRCAPFALSAYDVPTIKTGKQLTSCNRASELADD